MAEAARCRSTAPHTEGQRACGPGRAAYTSGALLQHGSLPHMLLKSSFFFTQPASFSRTWLTLKYVYIPAEESVMSEPQTRPTVSVGLPGLGWG